MKQRLLAALLALALLCAVFPAQAAAAAPQVKNIILMIPDGGGFGNYDLAEAAKLAGTGVKGQRTPITTDAIAGETHNGLYLSGYLIGTARTRSSNKAVTDSAAGGTAISSGYRTVNSRVGMDPDGVPRPSPRRCCGTTLTFCSAVARTATRPEASRRSRRAIPS